MHQRGVRSKVGGGAQWEYSGRGGHSIIGKGLALFISYTRFNTLCIALRSPLGGRDAVSQCPGFPPNPLPGTSQS